jgi:hypothetical protein
LNPIEGQVNHHVFNLTIIAFYWLAPPPSGVHHLPRRRLLLFPSLPLWCCLHHRQTYAYLRTTYVRRYGPVFE